jgi:hypothetical protein
MTSLACIVSGFRGSSDAEGFAVIVGSEEPTGVPQETRMREPVRTHINSKEEVILTMKLLALAIKEQ